VPVRHVVPLFLALAPGCQAGAPRPDAADEVARAVGLQGALEIRLEGTPVVAPTRLGTAEAIERALRTSPELLADLTRVRVALAEADQARLLPNPVLDFVLRFPEGGGRPDIEAGIGGGLLELLQRPRRISAADERLNAAVARAVSTALDVVLEVREVYASVQALDERTAGLRERATTLAHLTALARARLEAGEASSLDLLSLEARGTELAIELLEREGERTGARLTLARRIGLARDAARWELEPWDGTDGAIPDEELWILTALEQRPELAARRWELAALGDEGALAGATWLAGAEAGIELQREEDLSLGPGLRLSLPLFDDGSARRERATAEIEVARAELVGDERRVVEEVRRAHAELRALQASLERVRTDLLPTQEERRARVEAVYLAGEADVTAVLIAEQGLQESQAKRVELERARASALARLERAVGGGGVMARALAGQMPDQGADRPEEQESMEARRGGS